MPIDDTFWDDEKEKLLEVVSPPITAAALDAAEREMVINLAGIGLDWSIVNYAAVDWAKRYSYELVSDITETTKEYLQKQVSEWSSGNLRLDDLVNELSGPYGATRAQWIASTEVTRAYAQGQFAAWYTSGIIEGKRWMTAHDELVCPICGPLDGQEAYLDGTFGLIGEFSPPAHVQCRCYLQPIRKIGESFPDEAGAWGGPPPSYSPPVDAVMAKRKTVIDDMAEISTQEEMEVFLRQAEENLKFISEEGIPSVMTDASTVEDILRDGRFKTQFEVNESNGWLSPEFRALAEEKGMGAPLDLTDELRAVYGFLDAPAGEWYSGVDTYGDVQWILKRETISNRSTFTIGDSLSQFASNEAFGAQLSDPGVECFTSIRQFLAKNPEALLGKNNYFELQIRDGISLSDIAEVWLPKFRRESSWYQGIAERLETEGIAVIWK